MYTVSEYERHTREGSSDGSDGQGHPECAFCQVRYYDKTELYRHVTKSHQTCHLCSRDGTQYKYYRDYKMLEDHFRKEHFACDEYECVEKRNVVFKSLFDLQAHKRSAHSQAVPSIMSEGIIGGEYAKHDDEEPEVALAIRSHYQPRSIEADLPETDEGKLVSLTDKLDTVVAFLHVGIVPTGSEDPFGLRRSALGIVRIIVEAEWRLDLQTVINKVESLLRGQGFSYAGKVEVKDVLLSSAKSMTAVVNPLDFILDRLQYYGKMVCGLREDVIQAVFGSTDNPTTDLGNLILKMKTLQSVTTRPEFDPLIVGFKRAHRLVEKEKGRVVFQPVNPALFQHPSETKLREAWAKNDPLVRQLIAERKYSKALEAFVSMKPAIDDFFTAVMVNADDPAIRINRLSLLKDIDDLFLLFADFSQIVVQGS